MEKVIVENSRSKVVYNDLEKTYTKYFYSEFGKKIRFFLRLRRYPGKNYKYISDIFEKEGIKVAEIIDFDKYSVSTKEINGKDLSEELINSERERGKELINKYVEIVSKIINLGIYFGDFNFDNFIVYQNELYAIDLEDYRKDFFSAYRKKSLIKRLKRQLVERTEITGKMSEFFNGNEVFNEIKKRLK